MSAPLWHALELWRLRFAHERSYFLATSFGALLLPAAVAYLGLLVVEGGPEARLRVIAAGVTMGLGTTVMSQIGASVAADRFQGRLEVLRTCPLSKLSYYVSHLALSATVGTVIVVAALALLALAGVTQIGIAALLVAVLAGLSGAVGLGGLGAVIATRAPEADAANVSVGMAAFGLAFASPVFYELELLPFVVRPLAWLSPYTPAALLVRSALDGTPVPAAGVAAGLVLAIAYNTLAYRFVRWDG